MSKKPLPVTGAAVVGGNVTSVPTARRIDRFRHRGHIREYRDGLFGPPSWQAVFIGQGVDPQAHDVLADILPEPVLAKRMAEMRALIARTADAMPDHAATVSRHCPAGTAP